MLLLCGLSPVLYAGQRPFFHQVAHHQWEELRCDLPRRYGLPGARISLQLCPGEGPHAGGAGHRRGQGAAGAARIQPQQQRHCGLGPTQDRHLHHPAFLQRLRRRLDSPAGAARGEARGADDPLLHRHLQGVQYSAGRAGGGHRNGFLPRRMGARRGCGALRDRLLKGGARPRRQLSDALPRNGRSGGRAQLRCLPLRLVLQLHPQQICLRLSHRDLYAG